MNNCTNHPDRSTDFVCHNCGLPFCSECLTEIGDYYYCLSDECQKTAFQENKAKPESYKEEENNEGIFTGIITCPFCSVTLDITEEEQKAGRVQCPECNSEINLEPVRIDNKEKKYTQIITSVNQGDIAIIKSMFAEGDIDYYILGENFLALNPLLQPARIFVNDSQIEEVKEILKNFEPHIFGVSSSDYDDNENE